MPRPTDRRPRQTAEERRRLTSVPISTLIDLIRDVREHHQVPAAMVSREEHSAYTCGVFDALDQVLLAIGEEPLR